LPCSIIYAVDGYLNTTTRCTQVEVMIDYYFYVVIEIPLMSGRNSALSRRPVLLSLPNFTRNSKRICSLLTGCRKIILDHE
jgi:hypothetical protein